MNSILDTKSETRIFPQDDSIDYTIALHLCRGLSISAEDIQKRVGVTLEIERNIGHSFSLYEEGICIRHWTMDSPDIIYCFFEENATQCIDNPNTISFIKELCCWVGGSRLDLRECLSKHRVAAVTYDGRKQLRQILSSLEHMGFFEH